MATEIRKVLNLSLGESPKNLRELKSDINEIKSAIGDMVVAGQTGTTAFDQATKLLSQDMAVLRQTQNATKSEVAALDGSYNALVQTMRELKVEWRATNNEARRAELGNQIKTINDKLKDFDASIGNFQRNVGNYKSAWEGFSGTINVVTQAGSQFTSGLQAMSGILGLTTTESENMNKALGLMSGAMGALNSARGILSLISSLGKQKKATKEAATESKAETAALKQQAVATDTAAAATTKLSVAGKVLRGVLMTLGIGLIITAIGELAANFDKVVGWLTKLGEKLKIVNPETQKLKNSNEQLNATIEKNNKQLERDVELMQAKGASQKEILKTQLDAIKANIEEARSAQALLKVKIDDLELTGKKPHLLKKLRDEYKKNQEDLEEMEHRQAVIEAQIDTDRRESEKKAADARAAAAKKAAEDKLKADEEAAQAAARAREKAEADANAAIEKNMTERERLHKEHLETLKNLEADEAYLTAKQYSDAVAAENAYYANQLSEIVAEEYGTAYEKASKDFENKIKSSTILSSVSETIREAFDVGEFYKDKKNQKNAIVSVKAYYEGIAGEVMKLLDKYKEDLNPKAQEAFGDLETVAKYNAPKILTAFRDFYSEYLSNTEAFLTKYGEPFTTAIALMGEQYEAFAAEHSQGLIEVFNRELEAITEVANGGGINTVQGAIDRLWLEYSKIFDEVDPSGALTFSMKQYIMRFTGEVSQGLTDVIGASGNATAEAIRQSYEPIFNSLYTQMGQWRQAVRDGIVDAKTAADEIALIEADERRLTLERDSKMYEARVAMLRKYVSASTNLFDNVASAWEAVIKAKVKNDKMSDESARRSFENMKKLQYATAVINTAAGVAQALSDPAVPTYYLRAINAAAALAAGVAQIAKIAATSYDSAGSNSTSTPQLVDRTPVQQTVSLNAAEAGQGVAQSMRVYVVESDITEAQNRSRARVSESTF